MAKLLNSKIYNDDQHVDDRFLYYESPEIIACYKHFKERYRERFSRNPEDLTASNLSYKLYWDNWIKSLKGHLAKYDNNGRMIRVIGHHLKDKTIYKVVYVKILKLNIFVPLTIIDVDDHKRKFNLFKGTIKMKKKKE